MRFRLYREHGALNSAPIFDAFERGVRLLGHEIVKDQEDVAVIWSVLWSGRMKANQEIYNRCVKLGLPVIIIEVGNLKRNLTWRICLNNINGLGIFGNTENLDPERPKKLGVPLLPVKEHRQSEILIAAQHEKSQQWQGMPSMKQWTEKTVAKLRSYTDRKIIVRHHPRSPFSVNLKNVVMQSPRMLPGSYDDFDINYDYHCVINHNSGPAVQAAIKGIPVICDSSSLAGEISGNLENIESILLPDRTDWFTRLTHTEWTTTEIAQGIPLSRILLKIS
jgi:hypothetical protein